MESCVWRGWETGGMSRMLRVLPVRALEDNYMYLVWRGDGGGGGAALAVDPVEPAKLLAEAAKEKLRVVSALVTHHHWDHAGGNEELHRLLPSVSIYGGDERIPRLHNLCAHEDTLELAGMEVRCVHTPCHTRGHLCYFISCGEDKVLFSGDTLFIAGCGKFFEGNGSEMHENLNVKVASLPSSTLVYPGHEYTTSNLLFAAHVEPDNAKIAEKLKWSREQNAKGIPTVPSSLAEEKATNPFMRVLEPSITRFTGASQPAQVISILREKKNSFKPPK